MVVKWQYLSDCLTQKRDAGVGGGDVLRMLAKRNWHMCSKDDRIKIQGNKYLDSLLANARTGQMDVASQETTLPTLVTCPCVISRQTMPYADVLQVSGSKGGKIRPLPSDRRRRGNIGHRPGPFTPERNMDGGVPARAVLTNQRCGQTAGGCTAAGRWLVPAGLVIHRSGPVRGSPAAASTFPSHFPCDAGPQNGGGVTSPTHLPTPAASARFLFRRNRLLVQNYSLLRCVRQDFRAWTAGGYQPSV